MVDITLEILEDNTEIRKRILAAIRDSFNVALPKARDLIKNKLSSGLKPAFMNTNEYESLTQGPLNAHFGMSKKGAVLRIDNILDVLSKEIEVRSTRVSVSGDKLRGGLYFSMFLATFENILAMLESHIATDKGEVLPWLEWLLIRGDEIIISNYEIEFGRLPGSRSNAAIMVMSPGGFWKVPVGVSGTINDNWITRAVNKQLDFFKKFTEDIINDSLNKAF